MKFAVAGLLCLGVLAAGSAAFLVSTLRLSLAPLAPGGGDPGDVDVLVAVGGVPAMSVVDARQVTARRMPLARAPRGYISNPVEVVGKVLAIPMVEGQAFTGNCFAQGAGSQLAAALPKGKRAVGISVTDYAGLDGLLYPGSVVDVMVSLKPDAMSSRATARGPITVTLLQGVEVLAIERQTVVSSGDKVIDSADTALHPNNNMRKVTLLVDTRQAKVLQLAMEQGTLSLALRNPLDGSSSESEKVSLSDLTGINDADEGPRPPSPLQQMILSFLMGMRQKAEAKVADSAPTSPTTRPVDPFASTAAPPSPPQWAVTLIRGDKEETRSFPMPTANVSQPDPDGPAQNAGTLGR
jgi:Flp pilus assembly protein CpaB